VAALNFVLEIREGINCLYFLKYIILLRLIMVNVRLKVAENSSILGCDTGLLCECSSLF